jgi:hypothetical protein
MVTQLTPQGRTDQLVTPPFVDNLRISIDLLQHLTKFKFATFIVNQS